MRCEYCQKEYPVEDERLVGQEIKCPHCGIPSICSDNRVLIVCPECHNELEGELWMLGNRAECTYCGKEVLLSRPVNPNDEYSNSYLPANYQLGNYLIKRCIGIGGMGEVYLAQHVFLDRPCALKLLHPDRSGSVANVSLEALIREARLACRIHSPYIVDVMDVQVDSKRNFGYIVMEYVQGRDIEDIICEGPMSEEYVLNVARGVCQALIAAAAFDVVHRDIKPANILITDKGDVKLADLGIAKAGQENTTSTGGRITGTVNYAAPEQLLSSDNVDARADIYSLGATMYHMLSGRRPFEGGSTKAVISKVLKGERLPLAKVAPQVSRGCCKLVASMMNLEVGKRPASAEKLLVIIDKMLRNRAGNKLLNNWILPLFRSWKGYAAAGAAVIVVGAAITLGVWSSFSAKSVNKGTNKASAAVKSSPVPSTVTGTKKEKPASPPAAQVNTKNDPPALKPEPVSAVVPPQQQPQVNTEEVKTPPLEQPQKNTPAEVTAVPEQTAAAAAGSKASPQAPKSIKEALPQKTGVSAPQSKKRAKSSVRRKPKASAENTPQAAETADPVPVKRPPATTDELIPAEVEQFATAVKATAAGKIAQKIIQTQIAKAEEAKKAEEAGKAEEARKAEEAKKAKGSGKPVKKQTGTPANERNAAAVPPKTLPSQTADTGQKAPAPRTAAAPRPLPGRDVRPNPSARGSEKVNFIRLLLLICWILSAVKVFSYLEKKRRKNSSFVQKNEEYLNLAALVAAPIVYLVVEFNDRFGSRMKALTKKKEVLPVIIDAQGNSAFETDAEENENVYYVRKMLAEALKLHASDIFIDPKTGDVAVLRFRVDGGLRVIEEFSAEFGSQIINVLKVAASMDISERRRPQDGSFSLSGAFGNVSLRVATVGAFSGEKIALRILGDDSGPKSLAAAGLTGKELMILEQAPRLPSGMVLICGPTGSGKTTTLYAMLNSIDYSIKNVISIEDPIEHVVPAISQMEVNESAGIGFSQLLRNALRQNPDIICLGEIRDEDTAQTAIHAAQTGHLIIATLHSNDNIGTIDRLANLNIPLRSIAGTLRMVVSQRLVRKLCSCKKNAAPSAEAKAEFAAHGISHGKICVPNGCSKCGNTGYKGRMALFDILMIDDELRELLEDEHTNLSNIQKRLKATSHGNAMLRSGYEMVARGVTSWDEVQRVALEVKNQD